MLDIAQNLSDYNFVKIEDVKLCKSENDIDFYDIEVEDDHTFHIKFGDEYILSHNCDGIHIYSLIINMFVEFWPELIELGFINRLSTPLIIADGKEFFSVGEFNKYKENNKVKTSKYFKGLGSFSAKEFKKFLTNDSYVKKLTVLDQEDFNALNVAFDKSKADERKEWLIS